MISKLVRHRETITEIVGAIWHRISAVGDRISGAQTCVKDDPVTSFGFNFVWFFVSSSHCSETNDSIQLP